VHCGTHANDILYSQQQILTELDKIFFTSVRKYFEQDYLLSSIVNVSLTATIYDKNMRNTWSCMLNTTIMLNVDDVMWQYNTDIIILLALHNYLNAHINVTYPTIMCHTLQFIDDDLYLTELIC